MSAPTRAPLEERFLILAPTGRDGALTATLLARAKIAAHLCRDMAEMCARAESEGALGLMVAEEALGGAAFTLLRELIARQESWSDLPVLVFTAREASHAPHALTTRVVEELGNVTLLDRPLRPITMLSAANAALRARRRQYVARAELHAQHEAIRQRDQFLAMLGHELRNPLAAITMAIELHGENDNATYRAIVQRQARHLSRLVDDLLDVARVTSGKITLQRAPLVLRDLVERTLQPLAPTLHARRLSLRVRCATPSSPVVNADAVRLEQIVVNLLTNAIKYTPADGSIEIWIGQDRDQAVLRISDSGVGISAEMLPRVFEPFTQAEATLDRANGGMGVGLTLVRSLVELHGGSISAHSEGLGKGSSFTLRLPALAPAVTQPCVDGGEAERPAARPSDVLIVEDNDDSRELLACMLGRLGHRVSTAADGLEGVEAALRERPDALLIDIGLPGLDGYGVARKVRRALGATVYLIALTGYGQPEDRARALEAGFDVHLTKPVDIAQLELLLSRAEPKDALRAEPPAGAGHHASG